MKIIILAITAFVSAHSYDASSTTTPKTWTKTKILTKRRVDLRNHADGSETMVISADDDFQSFIRHSSMWVDKSLLPVQLPHEVSIILAPTKWGKSINLSMLKFYYQLPIDENGFETPRNQSASYRYFKEGKVVLENGTIEELDGIPLIFDQEEDESIGDRSYEQSLLANFPVIYLSGANVTDEESFRVMIQKTYRQHESLLKRLRIKQQNAASRDYSMEEREAADDISQFLEYYNWDGLNYTTKWDDSIRILCKLLFKTYDREVVILFDDYDGFVQNTYFGVEKSNSLNTIEEFLMETFNSNVDLHRAVITGVLNANFRTEVTGGLCYCNKMHSFSYDIFPFYGIFEPEFRQMADKRGIDQAAIDNATLWYDGFRNFYHLQTPMYSTHSVTRFINTLQIRDYWPDSRLSTFIKKLLQKPPLQEEFHQYLTSLETNHSLVKINCQSYLDFIQSDYKAMQSIMHSGECPKKYYQNIYALMLSVGYAAICNVSGSFRSIFSLNVFIKIPNREIYHQLGQQIHTK